MIKSIGKSGKFQLLFAIAFSSVLFMQGAKSYQALNERAGVQRAVTESVQHWKRSYQALTGAVKQWSTDYRREDSVQDLISLYQLVNLGQYGLEVDMDSLGLDKVETVLKDGMQIGLTKVCLKSTSGGEGSALEVKAPKYQTLFEGVTALANRKDIHISTITVKGAKPTPVAHLGEFCVLMRRN